MLGGIEAGGTKCVCAIGPDPHTILDRRSIPTTTPAATLAAIAAFFTTAAVSHGTLRALGIASFGPITVDPTHAAYGTIGRTPKPGWTGTNLRTALAAHLACPIAIDTDVNAAALAEIAHPSAAGLTSLAYITIGTGIGGGLVTHARPLHGHGHPEMGHIRPQRLPADTFPGICPFHADCIEGLASGSAILARTGTTLDALPASHEIHGVVASYIGQLCATLILMTAPQRIILGGGVMHANPALFPPIRSATQTALAGYLPTLPPIMAPALSTQSGITGALMLAEAGV